MSYAKVALLQKRHQRSPQESIEYEVYVIILGIVGGSKFASARVKINARKERRDAEEGEKPGLITIRTNHLSRNLVHKHKLNFDAEGERAC